MRARIFIFMSHKMLFFSFFTLIFMFNACLYYCSHSHPHSLPSSMLSASSHYEPFFSLFDVLMVYLHLKNNGFFNKNSNTPHLGSSHPFLTMKAYRSKILMTIKLLLQSLFVPKYFESVLILQIICQKSSEYTSVKYLQDLFYDRKSAEAKLLGDFNGVGMFLKPGQRIASYLDLNKEEAFLKMPKECCGGVMISKSLFALHDTWQVLYFVLLNPTKAYNMVLPGFLVADIKHIMATLFNITAEHFSIAECQVYNNQAFQHTLQNPICNHILSSPGKLDQKLFDLCRVLKNIFCNFASTISEFVEKDYEKLLDAKRLEHLGLNSFSFYPAFSPIHVLIRDRELAKISRALKFKLLIKPLLNTENNSDGLSVTTRYFDNGYLRQFVVLLPATPVSFRYVQSGANKDRSNSKKYGIPVPWVVRPYLNCLTEHYAFVLWTTNSPYLIKCKRQGMDYINVEHKILGLVCLFAEGKIEFLSELEELYNFDHSYAQETRNKRLSEEQVRNVFYKLAQIYAIEAQLQKI